jgi:hypothetical protein
MKTSFFISLLFLVSKIDGMFSVFPHVKTGLLISTRSSIIFCRLFCDSLKEFQPLVFRPLAERKPVYSSQLKNDEKLRSFLKDLAIWQIEQMKEIAKKSQAQQPCMCINRRKESFIQPEAFEQKKKAVLEHELEIIFEKRDK